MHLHSAEVLYGVYFTLPYLTEAANVGYVLIYNILYKVGLMQEHFHILSLNSS